MQGEVAHWILQNCRSAGLNAFVELRTRINDRRYRVADVLVLDGKTPKTRALSPEDRMVRIRARIEDFLSIGTRFVWLIDPAVRRAWVFTNGSIEEVQVGVLRIDSPQVAIPLAEIFANIDRMSE